LRLGRGIAQAIDQRQVGASQDVRGPVNRLVHAGRPSIDQRRRAAVVAITTEPGPAERASAPCPDNALAVGMQFDVVTEAATKRAGRVLYQPRRHSSSESQLPSLTESRNPTRLLSEASRYLPASPAPKLLSNDPATGLKRVHTIALVIVSPIRKPVMELPKSSVQPDGCRAAPLSYPRNIRPTCGLATLARRLQSWHINCDSVALAKG